MCMVWKAVTLAEVELRETNCGNPLFCKIICYNSGNEAGLQIYLSPHSLNPTSEQFLKDHHYLHGNVSSLPRRLPQKQLQSSRNLMRSLLLTVRVALAPEPSFQDTEGPPGLCSCIQGLWALTVTAAQSHVSKQPCVQRAELIRTVYRYTDPYSELIPRSRESGFYLASPFIGSLRRGMRGKNPTNNNREVMDFVLSCKNAYILHSRVNSQILYICS